MTQKPNSGSPWEAPSPHQAVPAGSLVTSWKFSRAKGALPLGVEAKVIKRCSNPAKVWVQDKEGRSYWPIAKYLEVVAERGSPEVWLTPFEKARAENPVVLFPVTVVMVSSSGKAALAKFKDCSHWLPYSQCPGMGAKGWKGDVGIPQWLVDSKGIPLEWASKPEAKSISQEPGEPEASVSSAPAFDSLGIDVLVELAYPVEDAPVVADHASPTAWVDDPLDILFD